MKNVFGPCFRGHIYFYTFSGKRSSHLALMILDDSPGRETRKMPVKANLHVIKVLQTCSIILIHGRSRGSFSTSYLSRVLHPT